MTQRSRSALKAFFETGDKPTEAQFADLIDSCPNFVDDGIPDFVKFYEWLAQATTGTGVEVLSSVYDVIGGTIGTDGQGVRIEADLLVAISVNTKKIGVRIDGSDTFVTLTSTATLDTHVKLLCDIIREDSATAQWRLTVLVGKESAFTSDGTVGASGDNGAFDWSTDLSLAISAETPGGAGELTLNSWTVTTIGVG